MFKKLKLKINNHHVKIQKYNLHKNFISNLTNLKETRN